MKSLLRMRIKEYYRNSLGDLKQVQSTVVTICTTCFHIQGLCISPTAIYILHIILTTDSVLSNINWSVCIADASYKIWCSHG